MKISYILTFCIIFIIFCTKPLFAISENANVIKKQLLNDPEFISNLSNKVNKKAIEDTIKAFLLNNPEFMLKIQQTLIQKQVSQVENERKKVLSKVLPTIYNAKEDLLLGNVNAPHTIVEFLDFNCSSCKKTYSAAENLVKTHPNIKIIIKELPILGVNSVLAHTVSRSFHELLPNKQAEFVRKMMNPAKPATKDNALEVAQSLGADIKTIKNNLNDQNKTLNLQKYLLANVKLAMSLKIQGTPAYIIDGHLIEGGVNLEAIGEEIDRHNK